MNRRDTPRVKNRISGAFRDRGATQLRAHSEGPNRRERAGMNRITGLTQTFANHAAVRTARTRRW